MRLGCSGTGASSAASCKRANRRPAGESFRGVLSSTLLSSRSGHALTRRVQESQLRCILINPVLRASIRLTGSLLFKSLLHHRDYDCYQLSHSYYWWRPCNNQSPTNVCVLVAARVAQLPKHVRTLFLNVPPSSNYSPVRFGMEAEAAAYRNVKTPAQMHMEVLTGRISIPTHCFVRAGDQQSINPETNLHHVHQDDSHSHTRCHAYAAIMLASRQAPSSAIFQHQEEP